MNVTSKAWSDRLLADRARRLAERPTQDVAVERRGVCIAEADGVLYGVPVEDVAGVLPSQPPAPLANAEPALLGIISRGGGFALVYDLAALMGAAPAEAASDGHLILLRRQRPLTAVKVARTLVIQDIDILSAEEAVNLPTRVGVAAYGRHDDNRIVSIIDTIALLQSSARQEAGG